MYVLKPGVKENPLWRWALPDRVFFASGACHILAWAFLRRYPQSGATPLWFRPAPGFTGNHIVAATPGWVFDYHGYSRPDAFRSHMQRKASRWWPGWSAEEITLLPHVLVSEAESKRIEGLWLREPRQFLHDALPRAEAFLARFPAPPRGCA
ncbi:hypothetical protein ACVFYP_15165 [Roseomonas sp. F4]